MVVKNHFFLKYHPKINYSRFMHQCLRLRIIKSWEIYKLKAWNKTKQIKTRKLNKTKPKQLEVLTILTSWLEQLSACWIEDFCFVIICCRYSMIHFPMKSFFVFSCYLPYPPLLGQTSIILKCPQSSFLKPLFSTKRESQVLIVTFQLFLRRRRFSIVRRN